MKQLSSREIGFLTKEFKELEGSRVSSVFQKEKKELVIEFYVTSKGKKFLRIIVPNLVFLQNEKEEMPAASGFCMALRRYLKNSRLRSISQIEGERILELEFEKEEKNFLIIGLFAKGNIILCDSQHNIKVVEEAQKWKNRVVKPREKYAVPENQKTDIKDVFSKDDELVMNLAKGLGLGGLLAEEVCDISGVSKNKKTLSEDELKKVLKALAEIEQRELEAQIILDNGKMIDVMPFVVKAYEGKEARVFKTFSDAISAYYSEQVPADLSPAEKSYKKKIGKIKKVLDKQRSVAERLGHEIDSNTKNAEKIYEKYNQIQEILTELDKAKEKFSWDEIKKKLKGHKVIKEVNSKDKKVVVEL